MKHFEFCQICVFKKNPFPKVFPSWVFFIVKQKYFFWWCAGKSKGFLSGMVQNGLWNEALPWQVSLGMCDGSVGACGMKQQMTGEVRAGKTVDAGSVRLFRDTNAVVVPAF